MGSCGRIFCLLCQGLFPRLSFPLHLLSATHSSDRLRVWVPVDAIIACCLSTYLNWCGSWSTDWRSHRVVSWWTGRVIFPRRGLLRKQNLHLLQRHYWRGWWWREKEKKKEKRSGRGRDKWSADFWWNYCRWSKRNNGAYPVHETPANVGSGRINVCTLPFKCLKRLIFQVVKE